MRRDELAILDDFGRGRSRRLPFRHDPLSRRALHGVALLSLQYVTDTHMNPLRRAVSMVKDSLTYFGMDAFRVAEESK